MEGVSTRTDELPIIVGGKLLVIFVPCDPKTPGRKYLRISVLWRTLLCSSRSVYPESFISFRLAVSEKPRKRGGYLKCCEVVFKSGFVCAESRFFDKARRYGTDIFTMDRFHIVSSCYGLCRWKRERSRFGMKADWPDLFIRERNKRKEKERNERRAEMLVIGLDKIDPHWNHECMYRDEDNREHRAKTNDNKEGAKKAKRKATKREYQQRAPVTPPLPLFGFRRRVWIPGLTIFIGRDI